VANGRSLIWDVTIADTLAASHLPHISITADAAADLAADRKETKYASLATTYQFIPISCQTLGPLNAKASKFLSDMGHRISSVTGDHREGSFLLQKLSISLQRFNSVCFKGAFILSDIEGGRSEPCF
jgi:hypothetical protein